MYVGDNPVNLADPLGLCPLNKHLDVNKTWSRTFPCSMSATQVMAAVQNDMGAFADNSGPGFGSDFPDQPLELGKAYVVTPGIWIGSSGPAFGPNEEGFLPAGILAVAVTSQSANGWTFTTDPSEHYINGTVSFSATNAGNGDITFSISAQGNWAGYLSRLFGAIIKAGEEANWNNMLNNIQSYCQ